MKTILLGLIACTLEILVIILLCNWNGRYGSRCGLRDDAKKLEMNRRYREQKQKEFYGGVLEYKIENRMYSINHK